jgi:hypothetical protein
MLAIAALTPASSPAQTRPDAASGYSPAQRRAVDALLARTTNQRNRFAQKSGDLLRDDG